MKPEVQPFARCGACRQAWSSWEDFVYDGGTRLLGFQGILRVPDANLLVFEHRCGSTVSILTSRLQHLLPEEPDEGRHSLRGTIDCPGHCLSLADLEACDQPCTNARDRELIKIVQQLKRSAA